MSLEGKRLYLPAVAVNFELILKVEQQAYRVVDATFKDGLYWYVVRSSE